MKKHLSLLLILFLLTTSQSLRAQNDSNLGRLSKNDWSSILRGNQPLMTRKGEAELRGTPFLIDQWAEGALVVSDSLIYNNKVNRYKLNVENQEIWIRLENKDSLVLTDSRIVGLNLYTDFSTLNFIKIQFPDDKKQPTRFVQILFKGTKFSLGKCYSKKFSPANAIDKGIIVVGKVYDSFDEYTSFYLINEKNEEQKVALKKSAFLKLYAPLSEKQKERLDTFCKNNKISNTLEEKEAIALVQYLDSIVE